MKWTKQQMEKWGTPLLVGFILVCLVTMVWIGVGLWDTANEWIDEMDSPVERGMAYIATAIVVHALFSHTSVNVDKK